MSSRWKEFEQQETVTRATTASEIVGVFATSKGQRVKLLPT